MGLTSNEMLLHRRDRGNHQTSGLQSNLSGTKSRAEKDLDGDVLPELRRPYRRLSATLRGRPVHRMDDRSPLMPSIGVGPSPFKSFLDLDLVCSKNSTAKSSSPAASQDITAAQGDGETETGLPSLESLLGLDPTRPHSNSEGVFG